MSASLSPDLFVTDIDRSVAFYKEALGLEELDRAAGPEGPFWAMLEREGFRIMLENGKSPDPTTKGILERHGRTPRATVNFWVMVADVAAEEARLARAKVPFHGPVVKPYGMKEVSFQDPDGYTWTLAQRVG